MVRENCLQSSKIPLLARLYSRTTVLCQIAFQMVAYLPLRVHAPIRLTTLGWLPTCVMILNSLNKSRCSLSVAKPKIKQQYERDRLSEIDRDYSMENERVRFLCTRSIRKRTSERSIV